MPAVRHSDSIIHSVGAPSVNLIDVDDSVNEEDDDGNHKNKKKLKKNLSLQREEPKEFERTCFQAPG